MPTSSSKSRHRPAAGFASVIDVGPAQPSSGVSTGSGSSPADSSVAGSSGALAAFVASAAGSFPSIGASSSVSPCDRSWSSGIIASLIDPSSTSPSA
ncbi:hypothetical protein AB433_01960 [Croceicoccus naphthovorans]|uniref:Uncharacterized protein n=1 Tax=Croceicoccus naphthovorans TaxID=1348774 RepID=A0A0G3XEG7_9SPHN|nr:hypothetical protein AB433_01960 [Croceicoccus naphthovorans]